MHAMAFVLQGVTSRNLRGGWGGTGEVSQPQASPAVLWRCGDATTVTPHPIKPGRQFRRDFIIDLNLRTFRRVAIHLIYCITDIGLATETSVRLC